jgi:hypothetical protein
MTYNATVAVCSEIRTKHSTQREQHVECLSVKPGGTKRKVNQAKKRRYVSMKLFQAISSNRCLKDE